MASAMQDSIDSVLQSACVDGARYRAGDSLGKLLAHISLTPYLVLFYQVCIVYSRRDIHEAVFLFGALENIVTKDTLQQLGGAVKSIMFLGVSFLVAYSRVYLGYHTFLQVAAGAAAGLLMAALWWSITAGIAQHFVTLQQSGLGRLFRLKDTWPIPDVLLFEQNCLQQKPSRKEQ